LILERDEAELHLTLQPNHRAAPFNVAHMMVDNAGALLKPTGLLFSNVFVKPNTFV
jgi:hypothetical protein